MPILALITPRRWLVAALIVAGGVLPGIAVLGVPQVPAPGPVAPVKSLCADCHVATATPRSRAHLIDWQRSAHAAHGVGCESCHGGDRAAIEPMRAHLAILGSEDPASPVHRRNLPATCGACHQRPSEQFGLSRHAALLRVGSGIDAPTCSTCHGEGGASLPSPEDVRTQCAQCHGVGKPAGHPEFPPAARLVMVQYRAARTMVDEVRAFIPLVADPDHRASLDTEATRAALAVRGAGDALHTMDYDAIDEKLTVALDRVIAIIRRVMTTLQASRP
jgi:hypothetical protein